MLYNNYEDYMRNVLGCSNMSNNPYEQSDWNYQHYNTYSSQCGNPYVNQYSNQYSNMYNNSMSLAECEQMYPEIYKVINPLVCEMCDNNNQPITEELVEQMTNRIYDNVENRVEIQNIVNLNIETRNVNSDSSGNNDTTCKCGDKSVCNDKCMCKKENRSTSTISEIRQQNNPTFRPRRNRLLRDLIRILILNRLFRHNRPPFRPGPRPMPPRPGFGMY